MTIVHHPPEDLLASYAAGALDQGCNALMATHLVACPSCRELCRTLEVVGGVLLDEVAPAALAPDALSRAESMLDGRRGLGLSAGDAVDNLPDLPGLPSFVRAAATGRWHWVAPGLHLRRIGLNHSGATRVFLLRSRPGAKLVAHSHTGFELTCVLTGSFSHDAGRFGPGDFDLGDSNVEHGIEVGSEGPCISLVAMQGDLALRGIVGRLMQQVLLI